MQMPEPTAEALTKLLHAVVFERSVDTETWVETVRLTMCFKFSDGDLVVFPRKFDLGGGHAGYDPFGDTEVWDNLLKSMQPTETELLQLASGL